MEGQPTPPPRHLHKSGVSPDRPHREGFCLRNLENATARGNWTLSEIGLQPRGKCAYLYSGGSGIRILNAMLPCHRSFNSRAFIVCTILPSGTLTTYPFTWHITPP